MPLSIRENRIIMIQEDYISFETAKLLKEKGFNNLCRSYWSDNNFLSFEHTKLFVSNDDDSVYLLRPTLQMAMKWLRKEKGIPIEILWHYDADSDVEEWYFIHHVELRILPNDIEYYETYEEAAEAGIKYCLENLI